MIRKPRIPMSPDELPKQRVNAVVDLPPRPEPFESQVGWSAVKAVERPKGGPRKASYLGQVEWAWSPMNSRISSYYIHRGRKLWILWSRYFDDNWERWEWSAVGCVPLRQASEHDAAVHLLLEIFTLEAREQSLDEWHWINEYGFLGVEEWREIGRHVWHHASSAAPRKPQPRSGTLTLSGEPIEKVQQAAAEMRAKMLAKAYASPVESEQEAIRAESLRRSMVRQRMAAGKSQNSSTSQKPTP